MTGSRSPKALKIDWSAVRRWHESIDTQQSTNELVPAWQRGEIVEPLWAPEYVVALELALDSADESALMELFEGQRLIHPSLLPLVAELLRRKAQGLAVGKPKKLTTIQEDMIRRMFTLMKPASLGDFDEVMAERFGVSARTIADIRTGRKKTPASDSSSG